MIRLKESIQVKQTLPSVFRYTSDFSNIQDWDPGVLSSVKNGKGETGIGTEYELVLKFGPFRPKMTYRIIEYEPCSKVVLKGEGETFSATDTIAFEKCSGGTRIDYQADLSFSGLGRKLEKLLSPLLKRVGKKAVQGLEKALDKAGNDTAEKRLFQSGTGLLDFAADRTVIPGMLMFSRYGYDLSRRFWTEPKQTLFGKKVVLTGGTSGIGKAAAFELAERNAFLTIVARNRQKAEKVQKQIIEKTGNPNVDFLLADLSLMKDIKKVAGEIRAQKKSIDVLINNAGALFNERQTTPEGFELTFATDLLGVFYLTMLLKDPLAVSGRSRIINVSSGGMYTQKIDVDDLENHSGEYNGAKAYARAKRGLVILTRVWAEKFKPYGISVHSMHPGWVDTPGIEQSLPGFHQLVNKILRTPAQGADTIVWLATAQEAIRQNGLFWLDRRPHETVVFPGTGETQAESRALWERLNEMISGW